MKALMVTRGPLGTHGQTILSGTAKMAQMQGDVGIEIEGEELTLLPQRAIWWESQSALLVADLHIGKGAVFRSEAVPLPPGSSEMTLTLLGNLLSTTQTKRLYILGDFWHAKGGITDRILGLVGRWRSAHADVEMTLVLGNHDRRSGGLPPEIGIESVPAVEIGPFVLKHHPGDDARGYVLCGHIHPAVRLIGQGRQVARLPAYWFRRHVGVLPAFGEFTGAATVYPEAGDQVFVIADGHVIEVGVVAGRTTMV